MNESIKFRKNLQDVDNQELWMELAKRYKVRFGKIEKLFHDGRPSEYTDFEVRHKEQVGPDLKPIP